MKYKKYEIEEKIIMVQSSNTFQFEIDIFDIKQKFINNIMQKPKNSEFKIYKNKKG